MKKIKQIILLFIFTFVLSTNVSFADNIEVDINKVGTKLGEEFIDTEINNEESGFDNSSKINKIKSTYGLEGDLNSIIIDIETNNQINGYVVFNVIDNKISVSEFGFGEGYLIDDMKSDNQKIIKTGFREFFKEEEVKERNTEDSIEELLTKEKVSKVELEKRDIKFKEDLNTVKENNIKNNEKIYVVEADNIKEENDFKSSARSTLSARSAGSEKFHLYRLFAISGASGGMSNDFVPVIGNDYSGSNNCEAIAALNMVRYWTARRSYGNLLYGGTYSAAYSKLYGHIGQIPMAGGQAGALAYRGTGKYFSSNNLNKPTGSEFKLNPSYNYVKENIINGQPVVLGINGFKNSDYGWHAVLGVGGEINQYGSYYRICDGWSRSLSKFISSSHIGDSWYYRWN